MPWGLTSAEAGAGLSALGLPGLLAFAPALLSKLGLFGDPQAELMKKLRELLSAANVGRTTQGYYQQAIGSPAFSQGQQNIAAGANVAAGDIARNLAARGIGTTGLGAILPGLQSSLVGQQQAGLRTAAYRTAQQQAQDAIQQQIALLLGQGPGQTRQLAGVGLESLLPFLQEWLKARNPAFAGVGASTP